MMLSKLVDFPQTRICQKSVVLALAMADHPHNFHWCMTNGHDDGCGDGSDDDAQSS